MKNISKTTMGISVKTVGILLIVLLGYGALLCNGQEKYLCTPTKETFFDDWAVEVGADPHWPETETDLPPQLQGNGLFKPNIFYFDLRERPGFLAVYNLDFLPGGTAPARIYLKYYAHADPSHGESFLMGLGVHPPCDACGHNATLGSEKDFIWKEKIVELDLADFAEIRVFGLNEGFLVFEKIILTTGTHEEMAGLCPAEDGSSSTTSTEVPSESTTDSTSLSTLSSPTSTSASSSSSSTSTEKSSLFSSTKASSGTIDSSSYSTDASSSSTILSSSSTDASFSSTSFHSSTTGITTSATDVNPFSPVITSTSNPIQDSSPDNCCYFVYYTLFPLVTLLIISTVLYSCFCSNNRHQSDPEAPRLSKASNLSLKSLQINMQSYPNNNNNTIPSIKSPPLSSLNNSLTVHSTPTTLSSQYSAGSPSPPPNSANYSALDIPENSHVSHGGAAMSNQNQSNISTYTGIKDQDMIIPRLFKNN